MTDLLDALAERAGSTFRRRVVGLDITNSSLAWLGGDADAELDDDARSDLRELGLLEPGSDEFTSQGAWARRAITREDRQLIVVRVQRGSETRTLELFHDDGLVFVIDDTRLDGDAADLHWIGYAALADVVNLVSRWLPITPTEAHGEELRRPLAELVAEATSPEGAVTLGTISIEAATLLDFAHIEGSGYFFVAVDEQAASDSPVEQVGAATAVLSPLAAFDLYVLLVDAIGLAPDSEPDLES